MKIVNITKRQNEYQEPIYKVTTSHFLGLVKRTNEYKGLSSTYHHFPSLKPLVTKDGELLSPLSKIVQAVTNFERKWTE